MPITLVTGPANAGKAQVLMEALRRQIAHGEEPLLVVPTRADVEHYLRELAGTGTAIGARVERFAGLIAEAVLRSGVDEAVVGGLARERLIEALVARAGGQSLTPGFARALADFLAELQVARVSPARLGAALASWRAADGPAAARTELGALYADYRATLRRLGRMDAEQRAVAALDALRERPALWGGAPVLFYGFDDLTRLQLDAIDTLGRVVGAEVTVSLAYEAGRAAFAGRAASFQALAPLADRHIELEPRADHYAPAARPALAHLERSLFEPGAARVDAGASVRLLEGGGERAELELIASAIAGLLREGAAPEQIAVLARAPGTYLDLLEEVFTAADIPFALQRRRAFADTAIGSALLGLLRCVPGPSGEPPGGLGDLLAWLRAPGLLPASSERRDGLALADRLELGARRAGALSALEARELWEQRNWRLDPIDRLAEAQARGPGALMERAGRELQRLFAAPRRGAAPVLDGDERDEAGALAAGRGALGELRELARIAPELAPAEAGDLARSLEGIELHSGERPAEGAVAVLDPLALRARRVRALFVCSLQEGMFPARPRHEPLLAEEERRRLAEVSGLRLGEQADLLAAERYLLYATVSRPQEQLVLSWHVADDDGEARPRSLFVDDVCDLFGDGLSRDRPRRPLGAVDRGASGLVPGPAAAAGATLADGQLLAELRGRIWSASSLEKWIACPMRWFVEGMLRPGALDPDAEPLARGGLAHAVLKDVLEGLRRETGSARLTRARLGHARELLDAALAEDEADHQLSVVPERAAAARRRLRADLERYLSHAAEAESPLEPRELELGFGFDESAAPGGASALPALVLGGGARLRGRIDRIDVGEGGEAVVYDYKASRATPGARWGKDSALQVALYMRAAEELLGLRVIGGFYQPLSGEDLRARGVLEAEAGVEVSGVASDIREHEEVRQLLAEAVAAARDVAEQAGLGRLEARPRTCAFRGGCMYPAICRCER